MKNSLRAKTFITSRSFIFFGEPNGLFFRALLDLRVGKSHLFNNSNYQMEPSSDSIKLMATLNQNSFSHYYNENTDTFKKSNVESSSSQKLNRFN